MDSERYSFTRPAFNLAPLKEADEDELLKRAHAAMNRAASLPVESVERSVEWGVFDAVMTELYSRYARWRESLQEKR